jgi:hypothetical protein
MKNSLLIAKRLPDGKIIGYKFIDNELEEKVNKIDKNSKTYS